MSETSIFRSLQGLFKLKLGNMVHGFNNEKFSRGFEGIPDLFEEKSLFGNLMDHVDGNGKVYLSRKILHTQPPSARNTLTLLASTFGIKPDDGAFQKLDAEYDATDAISIRGGVVFYQSGDKGTFKNIGDNDRLFLEFRYSFSKC